jgi:hypothetical protein
MCQEQTGIITYQKTQGSDDGGCVSHFISGIILIEKRVVPVIKACCTPFTEMIQIV